MGWPFLHPDFLRWTVDMYSKKKKKTPTRCQAATQNSATTQDDCQANTRICRHTAAPTRCQSQAKAQARRRADIAKTKRPLDVPYDLQPLQSQTRRQPCPAQRPPAITNAAATTFMAECATAEAQRT